MVTVSLAKREDDSCKERLRVSNDSLQNRRLDEAPLIKTPYALLMHNDGYAIDEFFARVRAAF